MIPRFSLHKEIILPPLRRIRERLLLENGGIDMNGYARMIAYINEGVFGIKKIGIFMGATEESIHRPQTRNQMEQIAAHHIQIVRSHADQIATPMKILVHLLHRIRYDRALMGKGSQKQQREIGEKII
jgi:hypothetical protein